MAADAWHVGVRAQNNPTTKKDRTGQTSSERHGENKPHNINRGTKDGGQKGDMRRAVQRERPKGENTESRSESYPRSTDEQWEAKKQNPATERKRTKSTK